MFATAARQETLSCWATTAVIVMKQGVRELNTNITLRAYNSCWSVNVGFTSYRVLMKSLNQSYS